MHIFFNNCCLFCMYVCVLSFLFFKSRFSFCMVNNRMFGVFSGGIIASTRSVCIAVAPLCDVLARVCLYPMKVCECVLCEFVVLFIIVFNHNRTYCVYLFIYHSYILIFVYIFVVFCYEGGWDSEWGWFLAAYMFRVKRLLF